MKRNSLLAKSLTLGLAVATAAASMSTPGGLMAPEVVLAETVEENSQTTGFVTKMSDGVYATYKWANKPGAMSAFGGYTLSPTDAEENTFSVSGTAQYVKGFTGFSSEDTEQSGYYLVWQFAIPENVDSIMWQSNGGTLDVDGITNGSGAIDGTRKFKKVTAQQLENEPCTVDDVNYFSCITYISPEDVDKNIRVIVATKDAPAEQTQTYTIDYSTLKFESEITAGGISKTTWTDVTAAGDSGSGIASVIKSSEFTTADTKAAEDIEIKWYEGTVTSKEIEDGSATQIEDISAITKAGVYTYAVSYKANSNYTSTSVIGQVTVGKDLGAATVTLSAAENGDSTVAFAYTGDAVTPYVKVTSGSDNVVNTSDYQVFYTKADATVLNAETMIDAPSTVGSYKLWVVPSETGEGTCYNSQAIEYSITPDEVTDGNFSKYLTYEEPQGLIYSNQDQSTVVKNAVKINDDYAETLKDKVKVLFKKAAASEASATATQGEDYSEVIVDAGTYDVYVDISADNIQTTTPAKIGSVTVAPYTTKAEDIIVKGNEGSYCKSPFWINDMQIQDGAPLDGNNISVKYKQVLDGNKKQVEGAELITDPINAGTYDVYVSYTDASGNCTDLADTQKTGEQVVIHKREECPTMGQLVIKNSDTSELSYDITGLINSLKLEGIDNEIRATLSVPEGSTNYFAEDGLKYENGEISVKLDKTKTGALTENTSTSIHVDFENSFNNYTVAFDIPVVITTKDVVWITIAPSFLSGLTYDGNSKELEYTISDAEGGFEDISEAKTAEEIQETLKDGASFTVEITPVGGIKNAGEYTVHATYSDTGYFGEMTEVIVVAPKTISATENFSGVLAIDSTNAINYNLADQINAIKSKVQIVDTAGVSEEDYHIIIKQGEIVMTEAVNAGTYDVYIGFEQGNYSTQGQLVKLGSVDIAQATPDQFALSVTADSKGTPTITACNKTIAADDTHVAIQYYNGNDAEMTTALESKPTAPGTYKVKVTYADDNNLTAAATATASFTIPTPSKPQDNTPSYDYSNSSSGGGSSTPTTDDKKDDNKKDDNKTEDKTQNTTTETKEDGTQVTTTETKAEDGSVTAKVELKNETTGVKATVNVAKDADGKVTEAKAAVTQTSADKKAGISASTIAQITEAAGTKDVEITTKIVDAKGKTVCKLTVNAEDLKAGNKMKVLKINSKTGEMSLVNKSTYKVDKNGNLAMDDLKNASYKVLTKSEADAFSKSVLKTVKVETAKKNVEAGKKTKITFDDSLNMANVAKITYKTSKKSVATVNANGMITAKKSGNVTVKATVTLKDGKTKTVKMTVTVKKVK